MATTIGEAKVVLRIDTSQADATVTQTDRDRDREREDEREKEREEREERQEKKKPRPRFSLPPSRGLARGIPIAGAIFGGAALLAEFGPAVGILTQQVADRVLEDLPELAQKVIRKFIDAQVEVVNELSNRIGDIETTISAAFGASRDTLNIAKATMIFRDPISAEALGEFLAGSYEIRKAQALGRRAERLMGRRLIGKQLGVQIGDLVSGRLFE